MATEGSVTGDYLPAGEALRFQKSARKRSEPPSAHQGRRPQQPAEHRCGRPLGLLTTVTGVSGSGKSSLISGILAPALQRHLHNAEAVPGKHKAIEGLEKVDKAIIIDQSPIGRTPRSNPATYTKVFDEIRASFPKPPSPRSAATRQGPSRST